MKKIIILIPVFNDWQSLIKLLEEINNTIEGMNESNFHCIVINDASTIESPKLNIPKNIRSLDIINMKENRGHARCNAFGIRYLAKNIDFDHLILMDGDGEDRPEEIISLVERALTDETTSVVANRIKRSEGPFFQLLYQIHKSITFLFTGKRISFGNYSCLTNKDVKLLSEKVSLWSSFSGSVKKHISKLNSVKSIRGLRYFGPSKMSLFKLIIHSFSIIAVFKNIVFLRSAIFIMILAFLTPTIGFLAQSIMIMLVIFNLLIFLVSLRENEKEFLSSHLNEKSIKRYTH